MRLVEISARLIRWPNCCACCCGPADTSVEISFTRSTGVKVIREQTKSWRVPYCTRCLGHIDAADRLSRFGWVVVHRPALAVLLTLLLAGTAVILLQGKPAFFAIVFGAVWAVMLGFGLWFLFSWCMRTHRDAVLRRERARQAIEDDLTRYLCDSCAREALVAAEYDGWSGTVHTFYFANAEFAILFTQANAGKVLG